MSEAISKGYHHIGCKHIDLDFFPGTTIIEKNEFSEDIQKKNHNKVLGLYKLENEIRNLKYEFDNMKKTKDIPFKIEKKENEIIRYCLKNNLLRNFERQNPYIKYIDKFR
ncbi:hypothetical protein STAIW_v1c02420 [Spiroplasma taiwanense CT-1]|uniref:Uncharacterized protein n=2 Tax=Spiroplasma taiwanense TaxID=2145 RepID=S5LWB6_9MOLU|nr:hypothetical protein [Spiroplasma taiwanense]AGR40906.1 hypothetical protein STAIW_v1c02420 [Spiroplasma taiwanense CT-1]